MKNKLSSLVGECLTFDSNLENKTSLQNQEQTKPRKSKRTRKEKSFDNDFYKFLVKDDPKTYSEAMTSLHASLSKEAVNSEMDFINTWYLTIFLKVVEHRDANRFLRTN